MSHHFISSILTHGSDTRIALYADDTVLFLRNVAQSIPAPTDLFKSFHVFSAYNINNIKSNSILPIVDVATSHFQLCYCRQSDWGISGYKRKHNAMNHEHKSVCPWFISTGCLTPNQNVRIMFVCLNINIDKHTLSPWTKTGSERKSDNILNTAAPCGDTETHTEAVDKDYTV